MITTTISIKNQITLPKFMLELLGLQSGEKLLVEAKEGEIQLKPAGKSIVDSLANSIEISEAKKGIPYTKVLSSTKKIVAAKLVNK
ncbi:AbrB/MazE/SpoVT family DNA-binding domain-containing protein [Candidatus Microgenomates bacterium]|nr:AbrB/MazE/SpoVT family DNA-binding domain-containing protein [Candidatus Microgenomates bacterium]